MCLTLQWVHVSLTNVEVSVTRFGIITPFWQNYKSVWPIVIVLCSFCEKFWAYYDNFFLLLAKYSMLWMAKYWVNNLVTLVRSQKEFYSIDPCPSRAQPPSGWRRGRRFSQLLLWLRRICDEVRHPTQRWSPWTRSHFRTSPSGPRLRSR